MNLPKLFTSPLAATTGVLVGLAVLAIPMRRLTSAPPLPVPSRSVSQASGVPAWLTLKLLAPANSVTVKTAVGELLWELEETPAGDVETEIVLPLDDHEVELTLTVEFSGNPVETAAFLTLAPDGLDEQTRHAIGSGRIEESLRFTWPAH